LIFVVLQLPQNLCNRVTNFAVVTGIEAQTFLSPCPILIKGIPELYKDDGKPTVKAEEGDNTAAAAKIRAPRGMASLKSPGKKEARLWGSV
jgi:hypothetical protein